MLFSANSAAFAAGILFFLTYFPFFFLQDQYETMSQSEKMASCLLHNVGMAFGVNTMLILEGTGNRCDAITTIYCIFNVSSFVCLLVAGYEICLEGLF